MLLKENSKRVSESKKCEALIKCFFIRAQPKFLSLKSMGEGSNNNRNHPYEHRNQNDPMTRRCTPPYKILELKLICLTIVKTMPKPQWLEVQTTLIPQPFCDALPKTWMDE